MNRGGRQHPRFPVAALAVVGILMLAAAAPSRPDEAPPHRHVVEIRGMAFHPEVLSLRRDDTVVWINRDIVAHTATATRKSDWSTGPPVDRSRRSGRAHLGGEDGPR